MDDLLAMADEHVAELCELRALGMRIARAMAEDVEAAETPEQRKAAADSFPKVARAVRQLQALEARTRRARIADEADAQRIASGAEAERRREAEAAEEARRDWLESRKAPVKDRVKRVIDAEADDEDDDGEEALRLYEDLDTRLDDETFEAEFAGRPYEEVLRTVHRDLGLPEPRFEPMDRLRAKAWDAQWADRTPAPPDTAAPDPDPPPEPDFRYASG